MAWENEDDKEYLKLVIETSMNKAMKPIVDELSQHSLQLQKFDQTLYGVTGDNGMRSEMNAVQKDVEAVKKDVLIVKTRVIAYASAATTAITVIGAVFGEKAKKMLGL